MTNIDCGRDGYKTEREIELEKKLDIAVNALKLVKSRIKSFEDDPMNKIGYMAWWTLSKIKEDYKNALKQIKELDK